MRPARDDRRGSFHVLQPQRCAACGCHCSGGASFPSCAHERLQRAVSITALLSRDRKSAASSSSCGIDGPLAAPFSFAGMLRRTCALVSTPSRKEAQYTQRGLKIDVERRSSGGSEHKMRVRNCGEGAHARAECGGGSVQHAAAHHAARAGSASTTICCSPQCDERKTCEDAAKVPEERHVRQQ